MDDKATAAKIVADSMNSVCETSMESAIVAALEAARREGIDGNDVDLVAPEPTRSETPSAALLRQAKEVLGIIDCTGEVPVVRRVLGTLPITEDGFVIGGGIKSRTWKYGEGGLMSFACNDGWQAGRYSNREAAESAAKAAIEGGKA